MRGLKRTFLCWVCVSHAAFAQGASDNQIGDQIIVTATRQAENLVEYAGSIDAIDTIQIEKVSAVHPAELLNGVAGVNIHRGSGQEHLTAIRSPVLTAGAGAGSFLYLEDGVPLRAAGFANVNGLFEAGSEFSGGIEVVKGPGSVLYGSNAVHGLVNVLSNPVDGDNSLRVLASDDGFASVTASAQLGSVRVNVSAAHDNGFRNDSGFDQQKAQARYEGEWGEWSATWLTTFQNLNQETAGFIQGDDVFQDDDVRFTNPNPEAFRDGRSYRTQLRLDKTLGDNKSLSLTPYARKTELEFLRHFVPGQALEENGHESLGLLSTLYWDDFILGFDAEYTDGFLFEFQDNPTVFSFTEGLHYDYEVSSLVLAGYGEKDFQLSPRTTLTAGARLEYTDYDYDNQTDSGLSGRFLRVDDRSDDFLSLTPKLSLTHSVNEKTNIYARYARGSRAPQTADLYSLQDNQLPGEIEIETLDSFELGLKSKGTGWNIELAGYYMEKDNFYFRNAERRNITDGETSHLGIELSGQVTITDWLTMSGDMTYAVHDYEFDEATSGIVSGNRVDTAPETLGHIRLTARPVEALEAEIEWRHVGEYFTDPANTQEYAGHDIFVMRSSFDVSKSLKVFGRIDNILDTRYADRADFAFGNERFFPGRPRTIFAGLTSRF